MVCWWWLGRSEIGLSNTMSATEHDVIVVLSWFGKSEYDEYAKYV
jgi:hypothetical protein